jgi:hypothetical protein
MGAQANDRPVIPVSISVVDVQFAEFGTGPDPIHSAACLAASNKRMAVDHSVSRLRRRISGAGPYSFLISDPGTNYGSLSHGHQAAVG